MPAVFGGSQSTPSNAITGFVQATKGAFQTRHIGQHVFCGHKHIVHDDFASDAGAQAHLAFNLGRCEALHAFF